MTVASFFKNVETKVEAWADKEYETVIKPLMAKAGPELKQLEQATEDEAIQYGIPIVLSYISPATAGLAGTAKMAAALPQLVSDLGAVGKQIAVDNANAVLQLIVTGIKNKANAMLSAVSAPSSGG